MVAFFPLSIVYLKMTGIQKLYGLVGNCIKLSVDGRSTGKQLTNTENEHNFRLDEMSIHTIQRAGKITP